MATTTKKKPAKRGVRRRAAEAAERRAASAKSPRKKAPAKRRKVRAKKLVGAAADAAGIVAAVQKKVKGSDISTLRDSDILSDITEWVPSGLKGLDEILGGGWAVGRASEVYGDEAAGKSALGHLAIREVQHMGGVAVLLDFETALDTPKMVQLGIDPDTLLYTSPMHMQEGWEIVWEIHKQLKEKPPAHPFLIVWDSVAASPPKEELEADVDKAVVGVAARIMSRGCRRMLRAIAEVRMHMMWINQERMNLSFGSRSAFGPVKTTSAGQSTNYASTYRVRNVKIETLKAHGTTGRAVGFKIRAITKKNRVAAPEQHVDWVIDFTHGPSHELTMFHELRKAGRLRSTGGRYSPPWNRRKKFKKDEWLDMLKNTDFREGAEESYLEVVRLGGAKVVKEAGPKTKKKKEVDEDA